MISIALIDDAGIVIRGIVSIIEWEKHGLELAGTAKNGIDGLKLLQDTKPDIVFTDIKMPGCSGLDMIKQAQKFLNETVYIIISGYNDFKYVKEAIGLGVIDYLEKPITVQKVAGVMEKAIDAVKKRKQYYLIMQEMGNEKLEFCERLLKKLLIFQSITDEEFQCQMETNKICEGSKGILAAIIYFSEGEFSKTQQQSLKSTLHEKCCTETIIIMNDRYYYLLMFMGQPNQPEVMDVLFSFWDENKEAFIGIGNHYTQFRDIKISFREAGAAINYAVFFDRGPFLPIKDIQVEKVLPTHMSIDQNALIYNVRLGKREEVIEDISEYLNELLKQRLSPELFRHECLELVYLFLDLASETGSVYQWKQERFPYQEIDKMIIGEQIVQWVLEFICEIFDWMDNVHKEKGNSVVEIVVQYIRENYGSSISLDELAHIVNINPTYLSILFKKEMKLTYLKFLTTVRMENAMELLKQGMKAKDVCVKVGYYDYRHFSRVFKKHTGMSPEGYKSK